VDGNIYDNTPKTTSIEDYQEGTTDLTSYLKRIDKKYEDVFEEYYFGPFDNYIDKDERGNDISNKDAAEAVQKQIFDKLITQEEDFCMIGYGQSGSGKTSSLIFLKTASSDTDGILIELCKIKKFTDTFARIVLDMKNIYIWHLLSKLNKSADIKEDNYKTYPIILNDDKNPGFIYVSESNKWLYEKNHSKTLAQFINDAFEKREVEPTPNNANSSRSHVVVCLNLYYKPDLNKIPRKLVICDLAGVENRFDCESLKEILNFNSKYNESNKYNFNTTVKNYTGTDKIKFDRYACGEVSGDTIENNGMDAKKDSDVKNNSIVQDYNIKMAKFNKIIKNIKGLSGGTRRPQSPTGKAASSTVIPTSSIRKTPSPTGKTPSPTGKAPSSNTQSPPDSDRPMLTRQLSTIQQENETPTFDIVNEEAIEAIKCENSTNYESVNHEFKTQMDNLKLDNLKCNPEFYFKDNDELFSKARDWEKKVDDYRNELLKAKVIKDIYIYRDILDVCNQLIRTNMKSFRDSEYYVKNGELTHNFHKLNHIFNTEKLYDEFMKPIKNESRIPSDKFEDASKKPNFNMYSFTADATTDAKSRAAKYVAIITNKKLPPLKEKYLSIMCDVIRLDKLSYNCKLRRNEGYMINQSLAELRRDIQVLIKQSLQTENGGPIFYEKYIFPYCRNININDNYYEFFLKNEPKDDKGNPSQLGILAKIMSNPTNHSLIPGFNINLQKINFGIFTVINLTNKLAPPYVNNPPNPPYINLNDIVMSILDGDKKKIKESCRRLHTTLNDYTFYKPIINDKPLKNLLSDSIHINDINLVIDLIRSNNAATLIGSLEGTEVLQNTAYTKLVCSYKNGVSPTSGKFDTITPIYKDTIPLEILNPK
jgi:hypothetical protein